jgi:hypothetical protein
MNEAMTIYTVIEQEDIEIISVRTFADRETAMQVYNQCAYENQVCEEEASADYRLSGDDAYSVTLYTATLIEK